MKIKAVCEATGLTDRAVRYYIEEGLADPDYTENYIGRRNYDFSEENIRELQNIVTLRKYGFSVSDIRTIKEHPEEIGPICEALIERKRASIAQDSIALESLERLLSCCPKNLDELVKELVVPTAPMPAEDSMPRKPRIIVGVSLIISCILPLLLAAGMLMLALGDYRYPVFNKVSAIVFFAALIPSVLGFLLPPLIKNNKKRMITKSVLIGICISCLPVVFISGLLLVFRSETDDVENYLRMDDRCLSFRSDFFFDLFPTRPDFFWGTHEKQKYHYYDYEDFFGHRSDIFAEVNLGKEDFEKEIALRKSSFDHYYNNHAEDWITIYNEKFEEGTITTKYEEFTHGGYNCIAFYTDAAPFDDNHENWCIYMFAYNTESRTVRYVYYQNNDYNDELPYFASLSW